jgi:hypothetical protein
MRYLIIIFLLFGFLNLHAQKPKVENLQKFDAKTIHFGFSLGINNGSYAVHRKPFNPLRDSLRSIEVINQSGFNLGIVSDLHIHQYFDLRFVPTLVFATRRMNFNFVGDDGLPRLEEREIESTYLDFPLLIKYRSARLNNFAAYFIAGFKYSIDLASNEDVDNSQIPEPIIKLKSRTTAAEVGVGTDFFLPYFKFALEAKMSYTLQNALVQDQTELSAPIDKLLPKMFFLTLLFEG